MFVLPDHEGLMSSTERDLLDGYDDAFELEMADRELSLDPATTSSSDRATYFRELFRMQAELVTLQDWMAHTKQKVVILFEDRDAAVSKRITQHLKPPVCRVVALPATNDPEHTQWCVQRHASHLPAAGEMALFDRSWYSREGPASQLQPQSCSPRHRRNRVVLSRSQGAELSTDNPSLGWSGSVPGVPYFRACC